MSLLLGQAGEHLTAAILLEMQITVAICPTEGFDLIAFDKSAHYRVECKTTGAVYRHSKKKFTASAQIEEQKARSRCMQKTATLLL